MFPPQRIVCLTEETVETLYLLGEQDRIVGISGYCVRPPEARREKPRVSAFTSADIPKILELRPDLVLAFSDLQADIVAALIRQGIAVHAFNQRSVAEILDIIARQPNIIIGSWCGKKYRAEKVAARPGFEQIPAVRDGALFEIKSPLILQPGPAALTDGLKALQTIIGQTAQKTAMTPSKECG
jgi:iron complex transport system substrate-binding protein